MKVFISWSGETSFKVAKILKEWIPCVIQDVQPYFSSEDIDKGARWSTDIAKELEAASFGILCVTKENLESQWLNFEAGALSKAIDKSKVCPLLFRLNPSDISNSPILQFQMTNIEQNDIYKLFKSINSSLGEECLDEELLQKVFNTFWPQMENAFNLIDIKEDNDIKQITEGNKSIEILEEVLNLLRNQQKILMNPDRLFPIGYVQNILEHSIKEKVFRKKIPIEVIEDMGQLEMQIHQLFDLSDRSNEDILRIEGRVKDYILTSKRLLRFMGVSYPSYGIFNNEE